MIGPKQKIIGGVAERSKGEEIINTGPKEIAWAGLKRIYFGGAGKMGGKIIGHDRKKEHLGAEPEVIIGVGRTAGKEWWPRGQRRKLLVGP